MIERRAIEPDDSIGDFDRFLEIADEHERRAFVRMAPQHVDDIGARTGVDALERFVEQQQPRGFRVPAGEHDLLLIATGQPHETVVGASLPLIRRL